jgi:hypothetical protein
MRLKIGDALEPSAITLAPNSATSLGGGVFSIAFRIIGSSECTAHSPQRAAALLEREANAGCGPDTGECNKTFLS